MQDGPRGKFKSSADSTAGAVFAAVIVACLGAAAIMLTIKLGIVLFT